MQRWSAEDGEACKRSAELTKGPEQSKRLQGGAGNSGKDEAPPQFIVCINLGDVPPENVNATITGRTVNITGERTEMIEEYDGMIRKNYQGFSNTFNIPPEVDITTLNLTICEKHTLLVEADYFDNVVGLEEYTGGPRQSRLKSLDKLTTQVTSALDLVASSEQSGDSLYQTALQYQPSKQSFLPSGDPSRRSSAATRASLKEKRRPAPDLVACKKPVSQEEGRRGSVPHTTGSRRPSLGRDIREEGTRSPLPQPIGSRRTSISRDGKRGPIGSRRPSKNLEQCQRVQEEENKIPTTSTDGEQIGSTFDQDQCRRSSVGSTKRNAVHEEGKRGSLTEQEQRKPACHEKPHDKGKRCSHHDGSRSAMSPERSHSVHSKRKDSKHVPVKRHNRPRTPSTDKSSNSIETSLNSSGSTISNTSKTSWNSDEGGSAGSIPTSMRSRPSITDTSGVTPKSTRDSVSSQQNSTDPRYANQISAAASSTRSKNAQKSKAAKKEKTLAFDSFPFCCCPQSF